MNGNQQAQEILYNKYKKSVKNFLTSKYSIYYDIDDDVSEIMIKIFMGIKTFDSEKSKFSSWVFSIAKNYMIDKWRGSTTILSGAKTLDSTYSSSNVGGFISNNSFCVSNTVFENTNSINYISTQLSPQDFMLLDMKYVQGYNYSEIGKQFNVTSSTISNRVNYIKTKLRKNISEEIYN